MTVQPILADMLLACSSWECMFLPFLGSRLVASSTSKSGVCIGSLIISEYASAMGLWRLLNCLIQKLGSLSGPGDFQLFNYEVLQLHLVDLLQFFLLILDPLSIPIVFDLQYVLPELLYLSYVWWFLNLDGFLSYFPVESLGIFPEHLILFVLLTSFGKSSESLCFGL